MGMRRGNSNSLIYFLFLQSKNQFRFKQIKFERDQTHPNLQNTKQHDHLHNHQTIIQKKKTKNESQNLPLQTFSLSPPTNTHTKLMHTYEGNIHSSSSRSVDPFLSTVRATLSTVGSSRLSSIRALPPTWPARAHGTSLRRYCHHHRGPPPPPHSTASPPPL